MHVRFAPAATLLVAALAAAESGFSRIQAQSAFEVVSIKPNRSGAAASETETTPGRINLLNVTPLSLLLRAFGVPAFQIASAPGWVATER